MSIIRAGYQFPQTEDFYSWIQDEEVKKRFNELLRNDSHMFNYYLMGFYKQIINYDKKCTHFEFKYLSRTNQCILELNYKDGEFYNQLTPTKEEIEFYSKEANDAYEIEQNKKKLQ
jgi:hypothetical protein